MLLCWRLHSKHIILFIINIKNIQPDISLPAPPPLKKKAEFDVEWICHCLVWGAEIWPCPPQNAGIAAALPSVVLGFNRYGGEAILRETSLM